MQEQCDVIPFKLEGVQRLTDALGIIEASGLKDEAHECAGSFGLHVCLGRDGD